MLQIKIGHIINDKIYSNFRDIKMWLNTCVSLCILESMKFSSKPI